MSNSFFVSLAPELSDLDTKITIIDTVADNIRNIDVPNIQTNIDANETKIDANKTVIDDIHNTDLPAVKTVVDSLPTSNRAQLQTSMTNHNTGSYTTCINITGSGRLYFIVNAPAGGCITTIKIEIDAKVSNELAMTDGTIEWVYFVRSSLTTPSLDKSSTTKQIFMEFKNTCHIQAKVDANDTNIHILYATD